MLDFESLNTNFASSHAINRPRIQLEPLELRCMPAAYSTTLTFTADAATVSVGGEITLRALVRYTDYLGNLRTLPTDSPIRFFNAAGPVELGTSSTGTDGNATFRTKLPEGDYLLAAYFAGSSLPTPFGFDAFGASENYTQVRVISTPPQPLEPTQDDFSPLFDPLIEVTPYSGPVGNNPVAVRFNLRTVPEGTPLDQTPVGSFTSSGSAIQQGTDALIPFVVTNPSGGPTPQGTVTFTFQLNSGEVTLTTKVIDSEGLFGPGSAVAIAEFQNIPPGTTIITARYSGDPIHKSEVRTIRISGKNLNGEPEPTAVGPILTATGTAEGTPGSMVTGYNAQGQPVLSFTPFEEEFAGGSRVAVGDLDGDGFPEMIVTPGVGRIPEVRIFDGQSGQLIRQFIVFEESFLGGVFVAVGDINSDGFADIVVSPDRGGGPRVRVFDGLTGEQWADFLAIEDPNFRGGVRATIGDVNADGLPDLTVGAGFGGGPRVAIYDGLSLFGSRSPVKLRPDFFVFEETLRDGVYLGTGDLNDDGYADVIFGGGPGGGPRVQALDGLGLVQNQTSVLADFFAGDPNQRGGVQIAGVNGFTDLPFGILTLAGGTGLPQFYMPDGNAFDFSSTFGTSGGLGFISGWNAASLGTSSTNFLNQLQANQPGTAVVTQPSRQSPQSQLDADYFRYRTYQGRFQGVRRITYINQNNDYETASRNFTGTFRITIRYRGAGIPTQTTNEGWDIAKVTATFDQEGNFPFRPSVSNGSPNLDGNDYVTNGFDDLGRLDGRVISINLSRRNQRDNGFTMFARIRSDSVTVEIGEFGARYEARHRSSGSGQGVTYGRPRDL